MSGYLNNVGMEAVLKSLDAVWLRQKVISNNIANSDTPGYKSKTVQFEDMLKNVIDGNSNEKTMLRGIENLDPVVKENGSTIINANGNNVDLDAENIELARAQLQYEYLVQALTAQINRLKYSINGGY